MNLMQARSARRPAAVLTLLMVAASLAACGGGGTTATENNSANPAWSWALSSTFPTPRVPESNPMSAAKVDLGRFLFYDVRLSGNGRQSCASCHQQDKAFTDGRALARGATGEMHPRSSQHLVNVVYNTTLTWANPALVTLEKQMEVPLFGTQPVEMGVNDSNKHAVLQRLRDDRAYPGKFSAAFPADSAPINWTNVIKAIASFQRTLISSNSLYDRYLDGRATLTAAQERGMNLFFGEKAECFHCHGSFNFNDQAVHAASRNFATPFHNTGLYNIDGQGGFPSPNRGVFELSGKATDMGRFRAPSLRNVEVTAPYMHDGSIATLAEVVRFYAAGGRQIDAGPHAGDGRLNPYKSDLVSRIALSEQEQADLLAFLQTLTDHDFLHNPQLADPYAAR